jgi:hypothetical protein
VILDKRGLLCASVFLFVRKEVNENPDFFFKVWDIKFSKLYICDTQRYRSAAS